MYSTGQQTNTGSSGCAAQEQTSEKKGCTNSTEHCNTGANDRADSRADGQTDGCKDAQTYRRTHTCVFGSYVRCKRYMRCIRQAIIGHDGIEARNAIDEMEWPGVLGCGAAYRLGLPSSFAPHCSARAALHALLCTPCAALPNSTLSSPICPCTMQFNQPELHGCVCSGNDQPALVAPPAIRCACVAVNSLLRRIFQNITTYPAAPGPRYI